MEVMEDLWGTQDIWIKHYSSRHNILLVGDGDFSFSFCLARAFASATNIVATSLDSYDELINKYTSAKVNLEGLKARGAIILHRVDATKMKNISYLQWKKFHRIIYNFPHAGFHGKEDHPEMIRMHRRLVHGFFTNAISLLLPGGEIHVNHKITPPFDEWRIVELASECSLFIIGEDVFRKEDYPGYSNKRGSDPRPDEEFPLGASRTFKFKIIGNVGSNHFDFLQFPVGMQQQHPSPYNDNLLHNAQTWSRNECLRIFGRYLDHVEETFGSTFYDVGNSVRETLKAGFEMFMAAAPARESSGYIVVLEQLHQLSIARSGRLRQRLMLLEQQH